MRRLSMILGVVVLAVLSASAAGADDAGQVAPQFRPRPVDPVPHFAIGVKAGTLGIGIQVGTALSRRVNLRGGANYFTYKDSITESGVLYNYTLQLQSVEAKLDLFVAGGFRVTPGLLVYNDNRIDATPSIGPGQSFSLGGTRYVSSASNPVTGAAAMTLNRVAPTLAIGFGNLLPRSNRHFSLSTDLGVAFQGPPKFALGFTGTACVVNGTICLPINTIPGAAADIEAERVKIQDDLKPFRYYPELSVMFGWKF